MDQRVQYQLAHMQEALRKLAEQQQQMAQESHQRQQQAAAEKVAETLVKILSSSYDLTFPRFHRHLSKWENQEIGGQYDHENTTIVSGDV